MATIPQNLAQSRTTPNRPPIGLSYSGLAQAGKDEHLAVHDTKATDEVRLTSFNGTSGTAEYVQVDWSRTQLPQDLEAIAGVDGQQQQFMAVEGSRYNGRTPHLFLLSYADGQAEALKQFDLPELPYEIEGMVTKQRADGDVLVLLGGRGDGKSEEGRLHWGLYDPDDQSMQWAPDGTTGVPVCMPQTLGSGQRPISDLHLTPSGDLWAAGAVDNGDTGPFDSLIYRVGTLRENSANPVTLTLDLPQRISGEKIEALDANGNDSGRLLVGADNESFGGSLQNLVNRV